MTDFKNPSLYSDEELIEEMLSYERLYKTVIINNSVSTDIKNELLRYGYDLAEECEFRNIREK